LIYNELCELNHFPAVRNKVEYDPNHFVGVSNMVDGNPDKQKTPA
jgi:hypothetical protein